MQFFEFIAEKTRGVYYFISSSQIQHTGSNSKLACREQNNIITYRKK